LIFTEEKDANPVLIFFALRVPVTAKLGVLMDFAYMLETTATFKKVEYCTLRLSFVTLPPYKLLKFPNTAFSPTTLGVAAWSGNANVFSTAQTLLVLGVTVRNP
jgi:hypothetical protein